MLRPAPPTKAFQASLEGLIWPVPLQGSDHSGLPSLSHVENIGPLILHAEEEGEG